MFVRISGASAKSDHLATGGSTKLFKHAKRRYLRYYNVSRDKTPHFFRALAASCVLYRMFRNVTEFATMFHGPGFINVP